MPFVIFRSIRGKIALLVAIAVLVATLLAAWASALREADRRRQARVAELNGIAAVLANVMVAAVADRETYDVLEHLRAMARIPRLQSIQVTTEAGAVLAELGNSVMLVEQGARPGSSLTVTAPVVKSGKKVGAVRVIADQSDLNQAFVESIVSALAAGLLAALAGIAVALQLHTMITRPIRDLMQAMDEVRQTNSFSRVVPQTSRDETGGLVGAFNDMLRHIRERDDLLARHRDRLEADVAERTRELNEARILAEHANAAKSDFLATMSHEIRTPMSGMLVMAELLASSPLPARLLRYADVILRSGRGLLAIINDILDLSKIEAGKLDLENIPLDPAMLADDTARLFAERAYEKGLDLVVDIAPDLPAGIIGDPVRFGQIISNLTSNALKFTEHGSVVISLRTECIGEADKLILEVTDTGIGIPDDKLAAIFDAFTQADQSTTRRYGGTGIGLSICRRLSEAMGGSIDVRSHIGTGTTFSVKLPLVRDEGVARPAAPAPTSRPDGMQSRVILALEPGAARDAIARRLTFESFEPIMCLPAELPALALNGVSAIVINAGAAAALDTVPLEQNTVSIWKLTPRAADAAARSSEAVASRGESGASNIIALPLTSAEITQFIARLAGGDSIEAPEPLPAATTRQAMSKPSRSFEGRHVLAADDSAVNREIITEALAQFGITVTTVETGRQAFETVQQGSFDLVLMDGSMPDMDGFEATRAIRDWEAREQRHPLPILALTAHVIGPNADAWREAGMDGSIAKPFTLASLETALARWLARTTVDAHGPRPSARAPLDTEEPPIVDPSVIEEIAHLQGDAGDLMARLLGLFREHAPVALERLQAALATRDTSSIAASAHALRSMSANIGAARLASQCALIETAGRSGNLDAARAFSAQLGPSLAASLESLCTIERRPAARNRIDAAQEAAA